MDRPLCGMSAVVAAAGGLSSLFVWSRTKQGQNLDGSPGPRNTDEMADRNNVMQPTDETVRLIWEGMIDADRLSRYYGYLAHRLKRLSELLSIGIIGFSLATVFSIWSPLPEWLPLVTIGIAASASILTAVMRYQEKAAYSLDLYRQIERLSTDWLELWADVYKRKDAKLRDAWRNLS